MRILIALLLMSIFTTNSLSQTLPFSILYAADQCYYQNETLAEISKDALVRVFDYHNKFVIPARKIPDIDLKQWMLIAVAMGAQNNTGARIEHRQTASVELNNALLKLPFLFHYADDKSLYGQIVVSPCVILKIPRNDYENIVLENNQIKSL